jgi:phage terminase small subunit
MPRGGARPNSGRKRLEPAVKRLRGTERADRDGEAPPPALAGGMRAPMYLGELQQLLFGSIAQILEQQGRASPHYIDIVALLAQRLEQIQRWQAVLEVEGDTYEARTAHGTMIRKRPEVQMLSDAMRHAHALLAELMITPATALRLGEGQKPEDNPFKALLDL